MEVCLSSMLASARCSGVTVLVAAALEGCTVALDGLAVSSVYSKPQRHIAFTSLFAERKVPCNSAWHIIGD